MLETVLRKQVMILVMSTGPRVHARVGGLSIDDVIGVDGLK